MIVRIISCILAFSLVFCLSACTKDSITNETQIVKLQPEIKENDLPIIEETADNEIEIDENIQDDFNNTVNTIPDINTEEIIQINDESDNDTIDETQIEDTDNMNTDELFLDANISNDEINDVIQTETETEDNNIETIIEPKEPEESEEIQTQTEIYVSGGFPLYNYNFLSGDYLGRVRISSVGINVAIYNSNTQATCDAWDSAMCFYGGRPYDVYNYTILIGDHNYQGFSAIGNCTIGTELYIDSTNGNTYKYVCDCIDYNGWHQDCDPYFTASDGHDIEFDGGLWLYTCNQDWQHITIVHFYSV